MGSFYFLPFRKGEKFLEKWNYEEHTMTLESERKGMINNVNVNNLLYISVHQVVKKTLYTEIVCLLKNVFHIVVANNV